MEVKQLEESLKVIIRSALSTKTTKKLVTDRHFYDIERRTEALSLAKSLWATHSGFLAELGWILTYSEEPRDDVRGCIFFSLRFREAGEQINVMPIPSTFLPSKEEIEKQKTKINEIVNHISSDKVILAWCEMSLASAIKNSIYSGLPHTTWSVPKQDLLSICSARYDGEKELKDVIVLIAEACTEKIKLRARNIYSRVDHNSMSNSAREQGEISQIVVFLE